MDAILVVFYSHTGVSRQVAQLLNSNFGWPLGEIKDTEPRSYLRCVMDSVLRRQPRIRYDGPDPGDFRCVVLVSPIWVYRLAGPMRSFIVRHRHAIKRVAVISTMGSGGASNAVLEITDRLGHAPILAKALTQQQVVSGSGRDAILQVAETLVPGSGRGALLPEPAWHATAQTHSST